VTIRAGFRNLELALRPRRFIAIDLICRTPDPKHITWRIVAKTTGTAAGMHKVVLRLPKQFVTVHIACRTSPRSGFACRLGK
jgi:hypothetical protein